MENISDVKIRDYNFVSSNGYTPVRVRAWIPNAEKKGIFQLVHGMSEHIERYNDFAMFLAEKGFIVIGNDLLGHGKSVDRDEDLGYISIPVKGLDKKRAMQNTGSAYLVRDIRHITKMTKKHFPGLPYIIMGHSMGSFLVRRYIMEYGDEVDGAVIMGTGNIKNAAVNTARTMINTLKLKYGERHRSANIYKVLETKFNEKIDDAISENAWISTLNDEVMKYDNDPLCGFRFTLNGFDTILTTLKFINDEKNMERIPKNLKILIVSGKNDPVGDYGEGVKKVYENLKNQRISDVNMILYDGCRHEILNDVLRDKVYNDIFEWINEHIRNVVN